MAGSYRNQQRIKFTIVISLMPYALALFPSCSKLRNRKKPQQPCTLFQII